MRSTAQSLRLIYRTTVGVRQPITSTYVNVTSSITIPCSIMLNQTRSFANREQHSKDKANMKKKQEKKASLKGAAVEDSNLPASVVTMETTLDEKIQKSINKLKTDLAEISVVHISPTLFDNVEIELPHGSEPLLSLASIASQSAQSISFTLFDAAHVKPVTKALQDMKFPGVGNLSPNAEQINDTVQLTVTFPKVDKSGRDEMRKDVHRRCEDCKSMVRSHRAWAMTALKKEGLSSDMTNTVKANIQKIVDRGVEAVTVAEKQKDKELLQ